MGTKNNPGNYDCYSEAAPDEPLFTLLARDTLAPILVRLWAELKSYAAYEEQPAKCVEARRCANEMEDWRAAHVPQSKSQTHTGVNE